MHPRSEYWVSSARLRLRAARLLFDEGLYDDCVNRCFFSAFHAALALRANEGLETRSYTGAFTQLFVHFVRDGVLNRTAHRKLHLLQDHRQLADYTDVLFDQALAKEDLFNALQFVEAVEALLPG